MRILLTWVQRYFITSYICFYGFLCMRVWFFVDDFERNFTQILIFLNKLAPKIEIGFSRVSGIILDESHPGWDDGSFYIYIFVPSLFSIQYEQTSIYGTSVFIFLYLRVEWWFTPSVFQHNYVILVQNIVFVL